MNWPDDRRPGRASGSVLAVIVAGVLVALVAACVPGPTAPSPVAPSATAPAGAVGPTASPAPIATGGDPASAPLAVDPALLAILPASIGGVQITAVPETAASMAADPSLGTTASGVAVGLAVTAPNAQDENLAVATVLRLRTGVYSDGFFNGWRVAYDDAACAPAGGVSTRVDQVIGLKTVRVTDCKEGARTYHVHLAGAEDILVSITSVGDGKFGDLLITGLRQ